MSNDFVPVKFYEEKYEINNLCEIRNIKSKKELKRNNRYQVKLYKNGIQKTFYIWRLGLMSWQDLPENYLELTVDHLDNDYTNNNVINLKWETLANNIKRARNDGIGRHKNAARKRVFLFKNFEDEDPIYTFESMKSAEKELCIDHSNIRYYSVIEKPMKTKNGLFYVQIEKFLHLPNEIFKTSEELKKRIGCDKEIILVSQFGRIKFLRDNRIVKGTINQRMGKYRQIRVNQKQHFVHVLVFLTWYNTEIPDGYDVAHNEFIELDEDGCKINYAEYLSLKSRSENMKETWEAKKRKMEN